MPDVQQELSSKRYPVSISSTVSVTGPDENSQWKAIISINTGIGVIEGEKSFPSHVDAIRGGWKMVDTAICKEYPPRS